jgi:hypothetical protein
VKEGTLWNGFSPLIRRGIGILIAEKTWNSQVGKVQNCTIHDKAVCDKIEQNNDTSIDEEIAKEEEFFLIDDNNIFIGIK